MGNKGRQHHSLVEQLRRPVSALVAAVFIAALVWTDAPKPLWSAMLMESAGFLCMVVGTLGRLWCTLHIAGHKNTSLQTGGPYSVTRNPLYFFSFLAVVGITLYSLKGMLALTVAATFMIYYYFVIHSEEKRLSGLFGQTYKDYCRSVPRFWPRWGGYAQPDMVSVEPRLVMRAGGDVVWFYVMIVLIDAVQRLQEAGVVPVVFTWQF